MRRFLVLFTLLAIASPAFARLDNKPVNYTRVLSDWSCTPPVPTASKDQPFPDGSGWNIIYPDTTKKTTTCIVDATSGVSPQTSIQTTYKAGDPSGVGRRTIYKYLSNDVTELYVAMRVKWDANYEWNSISNKLFYWEPGNIILQSRHQMPEGQRYLSVYVGGTGQDYAPTNPVTISLGEWHTIEFMVKRGSNGHLKVWLDGVQVMNRTGINIPSQTNGQWVQDDDTWGGSTGPRTRDSTIWLAHLYLATVGSGTTPPPTDTDGDGVQDSTDQCPSQAGPVTNNGCPVTNPPPPTMFSLAVTRIGAGSGTVANNPSGTSFASGASVSVTATPASGSTFAGWSGACSGSGACAVLVDGNKTVTAQFDLVPPPPPTCTKPTPPNTAGLTGHNLILSKLDYLTKLVEWSLCR